MVFDGWPQRVKSRFDERIVEQHALWIPNRQGNGLNALAGRLEFDRADVLRYPHRRAKRQRFIFLALQFEHLCAGGRVDDNTRQARALTHGKGSEAADAIARHFRRASVGVEQAHAYG